jgi:TatD DNase family protein
MIDLIDTHCHLADARMAGDAEAIIQRAADAGITQIVSVGAIGPIQTDYDTVALAQRYPRVYAAIGVHPHDADACDEHRMEELAALADCGKVVAIGETGMDLHYLHSPQAAQEQSLRRHLRMAHRLALPIVIHCRDAAEPIARIVEEEGLPARGGVIHCFTGNSAEAARFLGLGFYLSFSGIVTFKSAGALRAAAALVPDDRILIETDAPYLTPEPLRGQRNEPAHVRLTLDKLAAVRQVESAALAALTAVNARRLFDLPAPPR